MASQQQSAAHAHLEQSLEAQKSKGRRRLEVLTDELSQTRAARDDATVKHSLLLNQVGLLLESGQRFFQTRVKTVEALSDLLSQPPAVDPPASEPPAPKCDAQKRIRKLKAQLRERAAAVEAAELAAKSAEREAVSRI